MPLMNWMFLAKKKKKQIKNIWITESEFRFTLNTSAFNVKQFRIAGHVNRWNVFIVYGRRIADEQI